MLKLISLKIKLTMKKLTTLALIFCSAFLFSACGLQKGSDNIASVTPTSSPKQEKSTFSLRELLAKNIAQKCTWQTSGEQGNGQGEIIISGNKFKQTIKVESPTGLSEFISVSDGEWLYTWSNDSTTDNMAFKMKLDQQSDSTSDDNMQVASNRVDLDQELSYNCQPTTINEADFSVPKDIKFTDFSEFINQFQQ
ncbi:MAG TPA: hypothetical protein PK257_02160 [Candidatus Woesebacteria bacterium]|nr:hypothetical protein [Candidatus Woesebacteria bacterium]